MDEQYVGGLITPRPGCNSRSRKFFPAKFSRLAKGGPQNPKPANLAGFGLANLSTIDFLCQYLTIIFMPRATTSIICGVAPCINCFTRKYLLNKFNKTLLAISKSHRSCSTGYDRIQKTKISPKNRNKFQKRRLGLSNFYAGLLRYLDRSCHLQRFSRGLWVIEIYSVECRGWNVECGILSFRYTGGAEFYEKFILGFVEI